MALAVLDLLAPVIFVQPGAVRAAGGDPGAGAGADGGAGSASDPLDVAGAADGLMSSASQEQHAAVDGLRPTDRADLPGSTPRRAAGKRSSKAGPAGLMWGR